MSTAGSVLLDTNVVIAYFRGDKGLHPHFVGAKVSHVRAD